MAQRPDPWESGVIGDDTWIVVSVPSPAAAVHAPSRIVAVDRQALARIMANDPRPPEFVLRLVAERAVRRMPVPNGTDGQRLITVHNLTLVWPE